MIRQQCLDLVEQAWSSEQIEEGVRVAVTDITTEALVLPRGWVPGRMDRGWLLGWSMIFGKVTVSPTPAFPKYFQMVVLILAPFVPGPFSLGLAPVSRLACRSHDLRVATAPHVG
jgi:hypothetical protein